MDGWNLLPWFWQVLFGFLHRYVYVLLFQVFTQVELVSSLSLVSTRRWTFLVDSPRLLTVGVTVLHQMITISAFGT